MLGVAARKEHVPLGMVTVRFRTLRDGYWETGRRNLLVRMVLGHAHLYAHAWIVCCFKLPVLVGTPSSLASRLVGHCTCAQRQFFIRLNRSYMCQVTTVTSCIRELTVSSDLIGAQDSASQSIVFHRFSKCSIAVDIPI